jgi:hypothetical protein
VRDYDHKIPCNQINKKPVDFCPVFGKNAGTLKFASPKEQSRGDPAAQSHGPDNRAAGLPKRV